LAELDFITALGRVLHNGTERDAFAANPAAYARRIGLRELDIPAFIRLPPADLEFQARILPRTCETLGGEAWPEFARYARTHAPAGKDPVAKDALGYTHHLARTRPNALCPIERNRCHFVVGQHNFALHFVRRANSPGIQIMRRKTQTQWKEWIVYIAP
jgi:hypothetical protein